MGDVAAKDGETDWAVSGSIAEIWGS